MHSGSEVGSYYSEINVWSRACTSTLPLVRLFLLQACTIVWSLLGRHIQQLRVRYNLPDKSPTYPRCSLQLLQKYFNEGGFLFFFNFWGRITPGREQAHMCFFVPRFNLLPITGEFRLHFLHLFVHLAFCLTLAPGVHRDFLLRCPFSSSRAEEVGQAW